MHENLQAKPTLWQHVQSFMAKQDNGVLPANQSLMPLLSDPLGGDGYNGCHIWNNFMIVSLEFLRSPAYTEFFRYLDETGGFFYERYRKDVE